MLRVSGLLDILDILDIADNLDNLDILDILDIGGVEMFHFVGPGFCWWCFSSVCPFVGRNEILGIL